MSLVQDRLKDYINYGLAIAISVGVALLSRDLIVALIRQDVLIGSLVIVLLAVTVMKFLAYLHAVRKEVDMMESALDATKVRELKGPVFPIVVLLALSFAVLIAFVTDILMYSAAAVVFAAADLLGPATVNRNISRVLLDSRFRHEESGSAAHVLYRYYVEGPILLRGVIQLLALVGVLLLAVLWRVSGNVGAQLAAYGLAIVTGVTADLVILRWRRRRDLEWERASQDDSGQSVNEA